MKIDSVQQQLLNNQQQGYNYGEPSPYGQVNPNPYQLPAQNPYGAADQFVPNQTGPINEQNMEYQKYDPNNAVSSDAFAADSNPLLAQSKSSHCQSLVATILLLGGEGTILGFYLAGSLSIEIGALIGIVVGIYLVYLATAFCCNSLSKYLANMNKGEEFKVQYDNIVGVEGIFIFHASCYHYETRHHTRQVRTENGSRTQHYTTTEKVITYVADEKLSPRVTRDDSGPVDEVQAPTNIIFVDYLVKYKFSDSGSEQYFNNFYSGFRMRHYRDVHQAYSFRYSLPPFKPNRAFYIGELGCKYLHWFYISGIFGLVWPYSLWVEAQITRFNIQFMKVLSF